MNKKLIALAVAALAAPAVMAADNEVVLYGQVNVGIMAADHWDVKSYAPNAVSQVRVDDLNTNSRIGFKGTEDLGGGLKAYFQIETYLSPDNAAESGAWGSREAWVGLKGDFGKVGLGHGKTAYQHAIENFDLFDGGITQDLAAGDTLGGVNSTRFKNQVKYGYEGNGLTFEADYGFGEDKNATTGNQSRNFALQGQYNFDPFWVVGAYNNQKAGNATSDKREQFVLGGGWGAGPLNLGAAWQNTKNNFAGAGDEKQNQILVNASYDIDKTTLKVGLIHGSKIKTDGGDITDSDFNRWTIGAKYNLSKRTGLIAEYGRIDFAGNVKDPSTFTVGLMHAF